MADKDKLKRVLINITRNAFEAIPIGEKVTVSSEPRGDRVYIRVRNGGEPIPAEILPKLTTPFYSTKSEGTGLGLAIVRRVIEAHGEEFSVLSDAERGTVVKMALPLPKPPISPIPFAKSAETKG